jgi:hypothetical protein
MHRSFVDPNSGGSRIQLGRETLAGLPLLGHAIRSCEVLDNHG